MIKPLVSSDIPLQVADHLRNELTRISNEYEVIEPKLALKGGKTRGLYRYTKKQIVIGGNWGGVVGGWLGVLHHEFWHYIQHYLANWDDITAFGYPRYTPHCKREHEKEAKEFEHILGRITELKNLMVVAVNAEYRKDLNIKIYELKEDLQTFKNMVKEMGLKVD